MGSITVHSGSAADPSVQPLLNASHALMESMFPSEANHQLDVDALCAPDIDFFIARHGAVAIGCAALANKLDYGELKSVYVAQTARGLGAADMLLDAVIKRAKERTLPKIALETGVGLNAAHRLYARFGFSECDAFGEYSSEAPYSRYMELSL